MYTLIIQPTVDKTFRKLYKKDKELYFALEKKVAEILTGKQTYKYLKKPLQGFNRVHIGKHFVLIFDIQEKEKTVTLRYFTHHDKAYKWNP